MNGGRLRRSLHPRRGGSGPRASQSPRSRRRHPVILALIAAVICFVVAAAGATRPGRGPLCLLPAHRSRRHRPARRPRGPLRRPRLPGHVLFTLPHVPLPSWAAGVSIGGPVTAESIFRRSAGVSISPSSSSPSAPPTRSPARIGCCAACPPSSTRRASRSPSRFVYAPELVVTIAASARPVGSGAARPRGLRGTAGHRGPRPRRSARPIAPARLLHGHPGLRTRNEPARRRAGWPAPTVAGLWCLGGHLRRARAGSLFGLGLPSLAGRRALRRRPRRQRAAHAPHPVPARRGVGRSGRSSRPGWPSWRRHRGGRAGVPGLPVSFYPLAVPPLPLLPAAVILSGCVPAFVAPPPGRAAPRRRPSRRAPRRRSA